MKVAINTVPRSGPWGGGNRFVESLASGLAKRGDFAVFDLLQEDIDIILIVDPRPRNPQVSFTVSDIISYVDSHPETIVVHRINECDERKNTHTMNARLRICNRVADHTIFIASWLMNLNVWSRQSAHSVILNGADENDFPRGSAGYWEGAEPLRLVTHHWGANQLKGWDAYLEIDKLLSSPEWKDKISFCYIGNLPPKIRVQNINIVGPLSGIKLSQELSSHHAYITASQNEPAGMHHVEGAIIGLPIVYRNSGALPEYCTGFGEIFEGPRDVGAALSRMLKNYPMWKNEISKYNNTASHMVFEYLALFDRLVAQRDEIGMKRKPTNVLTRILNKLLI
ncbi:MAG: hypothetical protein ORN52_02310 [Beijerinckiaceae bacterium]|nr:hypothetical protein [Beijerinckiaceae bacterium]